MRSEKPLVTPLQSIPSLSDPSLDRERILSFLVQTCIGIRWVDLPSLRDRLSLLHIPE